MRGERSAELRLPRSVARTCERLGGAGSALLDPWPAPRALPPGWGSPRPAPHTPHPSSPLAGGGGLACVPALGVVGPHSLRKTESSRVQWSFPSPGPVMVFKEGTGPSGGHTH